jgi:hypothetical protein
MGLKSFNFKFHKKIIWILNLRSSTCFFLSLAKCRYLEFPPRYIKSRCREISGQPTTCNCHEIGSIFFSPCDRWNLILYIIIIYVNSTSQNFGNILVIQLCPQTDVSQLFWQNIVRNTNSQVYILYFVVVAYTFWWCNSLVHILALLQRQWYSKLV